MTETRHAIIDAHEVSAAPRFIAPDYVQHDPNALQGLEGVMAFQEALWPEGPRAPGSYPLTEFAAVLAEGDLVQLVMRLIRPDPDRPGQSCERYRFDLYRVKDGMIVDQWHPAAKGECRASARASAPAVARRRCGRGGAALPDGR